jgi:hypothetical protein
MVGGKSDARMQTIRPDDVEEKATSLLNAKYYCLQLDSNLVHLTSNTKLYI